MNEALVRLAKALNLDSPSSERLRFQFGYDCVLRVKLLLEVPAALECLAGLGRYLDGAIDRS